MHAAAQPPASQARGFHLCKVSRALLQPSRHTGIQVLGPPTPLAQPLLLRIPSSHILSSVYVSAPSLPVRARAQPSAAAGLQPL